jgi:hypothetical protein
MDVERRGRPPGGQLLDEQEPSAGLLGGGLHGHQHAEKPERLPVLGAERIWSGVSVHTASSPPPSQAGLYLALRPYPPTGASARAPYGLDRRQDRYPKGAASGNPYSRQLGEYRRSGTSHHLGAHHVTGWGARYRPTGVGGTMVGAGAARPGLPPASLPGSCRCRTDLPPTGWRAG